MPAGFDFAIFENHGGEVLYHSIQQRNLRENFYRATDDNEQLKAVVIAGVETRMTLNYKGEVVKFPGDGTYPCGPCDFVADSFDELAEHYRAVHGGDLSQRYEDLGIDPEKPEGRTLEGDGLAFGKKADGFRHVGPASVQLDDVPFRLRLIGGRHRVFLHRGCG